MARFTLPRDLYYGKGAMEELRQALQGYKKGFIVVGGHSMQKNGFLKKLEDILQEAGLATQVFEGVEPDPSVETVMRGAQAMRDFEPDVILSIGGGSPMDAAKAMWVFYEHPEKTFDDIKDPFTIPRLRQKAIFVAIPSTSGTASEVTAFSVITDYKTLVKYPLADFNITPDIAILDEDIPLTMPKTLTAHTGMDALTHATEAYVAGLHSDFSDPWPSASRAWPSPTRCWALPTPWRTRSARSTRSRTAAATRSCCPTSSATTPRPAPRATRTLRAR